MRAKALTSTVALMLALCGCTGNAVVREDGVPKPNVGGRFICDKGYTFDTVVDSKTGVTYLVWKDYNGSARDGITVLVDRDGKPIISDEVHE